MRSFTASMRMGFGSPLFISFSIALALIALVSTGCAGGKTGSGSSEVEKGRFELSLSDTQVSVEADEQDGLFYTHATIAGTVTNNSEQDSDTDMFVKLATNISEGNMVMSEPVLRPGESCSFSSELRGDASLEIRLIEPESAILAVDGLHSLLGEYEGKAEGEYNSFKDRKHAEAEQARAEKAAQFEAERQATACWLAPTGGRYHRSSGCPTLSRSKNLIRTTIGEAETNGYEPCEKCC